MINVKREAIPESLKREVRKKCGYGCIICGLPIYEYHHIIEYSKVEEHTVDNLILLCPTHHTEVTKGIRGEAVINKYNNSPMNLQLGNSKKWKIELVGSEFIVEVGTNQFINAKNQEGLFPLIVIDNYIILGLVIENENILLTLNLESENGDKLLTIVKGELSYSIDFWDIKLIGNLLTIQKSKGNIFFQMVIGPNNYTNIIKANFFYNGKNIIVNKDAIIINGIKISGNEFKGLRTGISLGKTNSLFSVGILIDQ